MGKKRSPNYPGTPLRAAIEDAATIYNREGRSTFPAEIAAKALGHTALSGTARSRLAALRQYGLIDQKKGGEAKLSDRALTLILRGEESAEYRQALKEAALESSLFQELQQTKSMASDEALKHHLVMVKDFTDDGASRCIDVFRATMRLANLANFDSISGHEEYKIPIEQEREMDSYPQTKQEGARDTECEDDPQAVRYRWPLSRTVTAEVVLTGAEIRPKDLKMLRQYLSLAERALQDHDDEQEPVEGSPLPLFKPTEP